MSKVANKTTTNRAARRANAATSTAAKRVAKAVADARKNAKPALKNKPRAGRVVRNEEADYAALSEADGQGSTVVPVADVTEDTTTSAKRVAAKASHDRAKAKQAKRLGLDADTITPKGKTPKVEAAKPTDPALVKVVMDHAEKNKGRNGWGKVLEWTPARLNELLAGAKTENAAIKRTRAQLDA